MFGGSKPFTLDRIARLTLGAAFAWAAIWLLGYLSDVLIPFAVAALLAYLMNPLVTRVQRKVGNRIVAVAVSLTLVVVVLVGAGFIIGPMIKTEIENMGRILTKVVTSSDVATRASELLPADLWQAVKDYAAKEEVRDFFKTDNFWQAASAVARKALPGIWGVIAGTASFLLGLVGLVIVLLYLIFILIDYEKFRQWRDLIPPRSREPVLEFIGEFNSAMNRYFRGQAMVAGSVGILFAFGFQLIDLPLGILLGLFVGLLNMVPYLQVLGFFPAVFLALLHGLDTGTSVWLSMGLVVVVFAVVQTIQDMFLVPKIMGDVTGLRPAVILLSLSVWGKLLGLFGLIIALPMTCLLFAYYQRYLKKEEAEIAPSHKENPEETEHEEKEPGDDTEDAD